MPEGLRWASVNPIKCCGEHRGSSSPKPSIQKTVTTPTELDRRVVSVFGVFSQPEEVSLDWQPGLGSQTPHSWPTQLLAAPGHCPRHSARGDSLFSLHPGSSTSLVPSDDHKESEDQEQEKRSLSILMELDQHKEDLPDQPVGWEHTLKVSGSPRQPPLGMWPEAPLQGPCPQPTDPCPHYWLDGAWRHRKGQRWAGCRL